MAVLCQEQVLAKAARALLPGNGSESGPSLLEPKPLFLGNSSCAHPGLCCGTADGIRL